MAWNKVWNDVADETRKKLLINNFSKNKNANSWWEVKIR